MYVDEKNAVARLGGNKKLYLTLLKSFRANTQFEGLKNEMLAGNIEKSKLGAHSIKGVAANLSLNAVRDVAAELEAQLREDKINMDTLKKLEIAMEATVKEVDAILASAD